MSKIYPSATAVLVRDGKQGLEVLLLKRSDQLSFAPGIWVFPGGRVDDADYCGNLDDLDTAAKRAAVRETCEESGLVIDIEKLCYFSHWVTPENNSKRFATWFFITSIDCTGDHIEVDNSEIVDYRWCSPEQALADHQAQRLKLMPPTFITLSELRKCHDVKEAIARLSNQPVKIIKPKLTKTENGVAMLYPGDEGYEQSDQLAEGSKNRLWLADQGWRYEKTE